VSLNKHSKILATLLLLNYNIYAADGNVESDSIKSDFFGNLETVTINPPKEIEISDNGVVVAKQYNLGPNISIKRKRPNFRLWWNVKAPKISANCSEIKLEGMFGTLINLDDMKTQLQDSGKSVAWGIMVGLIYSLPGLSSVFNKINEWARKLQSLMSQGCNAGIQIGKALGDKGMKSITGKTGPEWDKANAESMAKIEKSSPNPITKFASYLYEKMGVPEDVRKEVISMAKMLLKKNGPLVNSIYYIGNSDKAYISTLMSNAQELNQYLSNLKHTEKDIDSLFGSDTFQNDTLFIGLLLDSIFGSNPISKNDNSLFLKNAANITEDIKEEDLIKNIQTITNSIAEDNKVPGTGQVDIIIDFILNGFDSASIDENGEVQTTTTNLSNLIINDIGIMSTGNLGGDDLGGLLPQTYVYSIYGGKYSKQDHPNITNYLDNFQGINTMADEIYTNFLEKKTNDSNYQKSLDIINAHIPNIAKYIMIIKQTTYKKDVRLYKEKVKKLIKFSLFDSFIKKIINISGDLVSININNESSNQEITEDESAGNSKKDSPATEQGTDETTNIIMPKDDYSDNIITLEQVISLKRSELFGKDDFYTQISEFEQEMRALDKENKKNVLEQNAR
jgi:hypothetical protein